jgi:hypothetical protein
MGGYQDGNMGSICPYVHTGELTSFPPITREIYLDKMNQTVLWDQQGIRTIGVTKDVNSLSVEVVSNDMTPFLRPVI